VGALVGEDWPRRGGAGWQVDLLHRAFGWSVVLVGGGKCCGTLLSQHTTILSSTSSTKGTSDNGQNWVRQPCPQPGKPRSLPVLLIDRRPSTWRELGPALNRPPPLFCSSVKSLWHIRIDLLFAQWSLGLERNKASTTWQVFKLQLSGLCSCPTTCFFGCEQ
jgi:hypothetical protein